MVAALQDITMPHHSLNGSGHSEAALRRLVTLEEFEEIAAAWPDERLELINGEIETAPPPDNFHIEKSDLLLELFIAHAAEIAALNCQLSQSCWLAVPTELHEWWTREGVRGPSNVGPDLAIRYRDLIRKPDLYATLEIPTYWVVDHRDKSVWVHTQPRDGQYAKREHCKGRRKLPAPGLEFLHITPGRIFEA